MTMRRLFMFAGVILVGGVVVALFLFPSRRPGANAPSHGPAADLSTVEPGPPLASPKEKDVLERGDGPQAPMAQTPQVTAPLAENAPVNSAPKTPARVVAALPPMSSTPIPSTPPAAASEPVEKNGLGLVIQPTKRTFSSNEPLVLNITYRNTSNAAFRLPDQPALYNFWQLRAQDVNTGKIYTGGTTRPVGGIPNTGTPSSPITSGEELTTTVAFQGYAFIQGDLDAAAFHEAVFEMARARDGFPSLPAGTYAIRAEIRFAGTADIKANSPPVWSGNVILSNPVEVTITP